MVAAGGRQKIRIDPSACPDPLGCRLCLDRCPAKVFGTYPRRRREPGSAAGDWTIFAAFSSHCTGCGECTTFCPSRAISVR